MRYHGALHLHSNYSYDAKLSLAELKDVLVERGVSFALMTEHTDELTVEKVRAFADECRALSDESFLFVPGLEVSFSDLHILMPGCETFHSQHATKDELVMWSGESPLVIVAHPHRNGYRLDEIPEDVHVDGIEIWNAQYDGKLVPRNGARALFARESVRRKNLRAFAGWDFHREAHAGGPLIAIDVPELTRDQVIVALMEGRYTLRSAVVEVTSAGALSGADPRWVSAMSALYVHAIRTAKVINRVLAWFGLRLPKKLVAAARSRL